MGPYKRNWFVGGTVLLGLVTLAFLIIMFGGSLGSVFAGEKIHVTFKSARGDGVSDGAAIRYLGQAVGTVKQIHLVLDKEPNFVIIDGELDRDKALKIRGDVRGAIRITSALGSAAIIELTLPSTPDNGQRLTPGTEIPTIYTGLDILPAGFGDLADEMRGAVHDFREANVIPDFKKAVNNFNDQITKAGEVMTSINSVIGTPQGQTDLKEAITKAREAVEHANAMTANLEQMSVDLKPKLDQTMNDAQAGVTDARKTITLAQERIASVSDNLNRNLDKIAGVLDDARQISNKVNNGDGTMAKLLNDPKLYNTIVTMTEVINQTVKDVQRVVRGIEEEGFPIKLK